MFLLPPTEISEQLTFDVFQQPDDGLGARASPPARADVAYVPVMNSFYRRAKVQHASYPPRF
jgi:hypothetical protein